MTIVSITPSEQQRKAIKSINVWFHQTSKQVFYLAGYAGTGKSTLIHYIVDELGLEYDFQGDVMYGAYTGKAALNMIKKAK